MTENTPSLGGNAEAEVRRRVDRRVELLDEVSEMTEKLKGWKAEDKADGFNEKAIADAVKLRRADADKVLATLMYEAERDLYRKAAGLPIDIEAAQSRARDEAESLPEPKERRRSLVDALEDPALEGMAVSIGGGPYHELGPGRRKARRDE